MDAVPGAAPILERRAPDGASPLSADDFSELMAPLGPFEAAPLLAVAVSGGGDSLALVHLAQSWVQARGGRVLGLTVDHGLRPESAAEAAQVAAWLAEAGIEHRTLAWQGPKPDSALQEKARAVRYRLLEAECRRAGALHLLLGHHRDDQAETHLMRRRRDSGADGLAGMAAVAERPGVRLLRPLLPVPGSRLRATLAVAGRPWIEDPSNRDLAFTRVRLRGELESGRGVALAGETRAYGRKRVRAEEARWRLLAEACVLHPAGHAVIDGVRLAAAPSEVAEAALARLAACVGGREHLPRRDRVARLLSRVCAVPDGARGTLAGCRLLPHEGRLLLCREMRDLPPPLTVAAGEAVDWDGRFRFHFSGPGMARLAPLGPEGWAQVVTDAPGLRRHPVPHAVRLSLPSLWDEAGVSAVPHLDYKRERGSPSAWIAVRPRESLSGVGFCVA